MSVLNAFRLEDQVAIVTGAGAGAILNISSMAAENKNRNMASYSSSKAAAIHLTRNIAFDPWQTIAVVSRLSIDIFTNR